MAESPSSADARMHRAACRMLHPLGLRAYFAAKLPLALFAGLRIRTLDRRRCIVTVPYGWRTTNPFRSTYFAAQSMAAELSTGALVLLAVEASGEPVSMLITGMHADFEKKASDTLTFTCEHGDAAFEAVLTTLHSGEPVVIELPTVGHLPDGTVAARFTFTWSVKRKAIA